MIILLMWLASPIGAKGRREMRDITSRSLNNLYPAAEFKSPCWIHTLCSCLQLSDADRKY